MFSINSVLHSQLVTHLSIKQVLHPYKIPSFPFYSKKKEMPIDKMN